MQHTTECTELAAIRIWDNNDETTVPTWKDAVTLAVEYLASGTSECTCN